MLLPYGTNCAYYRRPYVTYSIIGVCGAVELLRMAAGESHDLTISYGFVPGYGSLVTLFTSMFLHGSFMHLAGNMLFLYITGVKVEDALGGWRYLLLYLGSGIAANMLFVLFAGDIPKPMIGASGAIAGVLGAYMILYPFSKVKMAYYFFFRIGTYEVVSWLYLAYWFGMQLLSFAYIKESGVAFGAHVGGFGAGAIWAWSFYGWDQGKDLDFGHADVVFAADGGI